jgi:hypothetical protein
MKLITKIGPHQTNAVDTACFALSSISLSCRHQIAERPT